MHGLQTIRSRTPLTRAMACLALLAAVAFVVSGTLHVHGVSGSSCGDCDTGLGQHQVAHQHGDAFCPACALAHVLATRTAAPVPVAASAPPAAVEAAVAASAHARTPSTLHARAPPALS